MSNDDEKISDGLWLFKRPNSSIWWARIKEADGWNRYTTKETDKAKARTAAIMLMGKGQGLAQAGRSSKGHKFADASKLYVQHLDDLEKKGQDKPSHANYRLYVRKWIDPFFKSKRIDAIDHDVINAWELWRVEVQQTELQARLQKKFKDDWQDKYEAALEDLAPLSRSSVKGMHIVLREIFAIAKRKGWIKADQIPELVNNGQKSTARPWFTAKEMKGLVAFMDGGWIDAPDEPSNDGKQLKVHTQKTKWMRQLLYWYILILNDSGMRPGDEIDELHWRHVDLTFIADDGVNYPKVKITRGKAASIGKERTIICMPSSIGYFKAIAKFHGQTEPNDLVFQLPDGTKPYRFSDLFADLLEAAGLKKDSEGNERTLYSIRHTFITTRLLNNVSAPLLAAQCGTSIKMIDEYYNKLTADMNAADLMHVKPEKAAGALHGAMSVPFDFTGLYVPPQQKR